MATRDLGVWLHGLEVARLRGTSTGRVSLRYTEEALDRWPGNVPLLSCSLPLRRQRLDASAFCEGLLPEGQHRQALAALARVASFDTLGLLARFGRDVAGALVISAEPPEARVGTVQPYDEHTLDQEVRELDEHPLGAHDDSELSIAGLQDKLLLVRLPDDRWGRPVHGAPSTHILKVDSLRHPGIVAAEHAALQLAERAGLNAPRAELLVRGDREVLIVERFDRTLGEHGGVERVHQEDTCQALAIDPTSARGHGKYEAAGGPSFRAVAELLQRWGPTSDVELVELLKLVVFTVLVGNADAHGKNLAFLHREPGRVTLAPLYDVVPTALWPQLRTEAAMFVGGVRNLALVTRDDIAREAASWGLSDKRVMPLLEEICARVEAALGEAAHEGLAAHVRRRLETLAVR